MKLLTSHASNPKIAKGEKLGVLTWVLHLAPHTLSGANVCPMSTPGCRALCLNTAGRGGIFKHGETTNTIQEARKRRTRYFYNDREAFLAQLSHEIALAELYAERHGMPIAIRLNGTSDLMWEHIPCFRAGPTLLERFPRVQFYDYTKIAKRMFADRPSNYHLTYSLSEMLDSALMADKVLHAGHNVAIVYRTAAGATEAIRTGIRLQGKIWKAIDGDVSDLRFTDPAPRFVVLKAKGRIAKNDRSGFVRD